MNRLNDSLRMGAKSPLGRRFAALTVCCSSVIALFMTGLQLYLDFRRDRDEIFQSVSMIETTMMPVLAESLWLLDEILIRSQLEGMVHVKGIRFAALRDSGGTVWSAGQQNASLGRDFELAVKRNGRKSEQELGLLVVQADFQEVYARVLSRGGVILTTNGIKTAAVAGCILVIYYLTVGGQLVRLAQHSNTLRPGQKPVRFSLSPTPGRPEEQASELVQLAQAINRSAEASYAYSRELDTSNRQLLEANREQAEFTYAISHDLKSPSNTIGMLIGELEQIDLKNPDALQILTDMKHTNARMGQLVEDVLNYARIIEERPVHETVDVKKLLQELLKDLAADIALNDAAIHIGPLPPIHGHALQLRILFQNLLANAIKFRSSSQPPLIEVRTVPPREGDLPDQVRISVSDNGIGIPQEFRNKVFGLFQRLHARSSYAGSGLGLTICRRIVSNHRGSISIRDGIGNGTTFELLLWLREPPNEHLHQPDGKKAI